MSVRDIGHLCVPIKGMHRQLRVYYALLLFSTMRMRHGQYGTPIEPDVSVLVASVTLI